MADPVSVEQNGVTITTNTGATEAELRAELDAAASPSPTPAAEATPEAPAVAGMARDERGRFAGKAAAEPAPAAETPAAAETPTPAEAPPEPQRRRDDASPRHNPIARMNQALAQKAEADRRAAALEAELLRVRQTSAAAAPTPSAAPTPVSAPDGEPQFEQFAQEADPYTAYVQAWARWDNRRQITETITQLREQQQAEARVQAFTKHLETGRSAYPDFDQVLTQADTLGLQVSAVMREAIMESPKAADLVHYLGTHPEECTQLALESEHTPPAAAPVMRRLLESHLAPRAVSPNGGSGAAARPSASTAKPPIQPVGSSPVTHDDPPGDDASAAEHRRYWNRKLGVVG